MQSRSNIKLLKVNTGELLNTFRGHGDEVFDIAFSADGKRLASLGVYDAVKCGIQTPGREVKWLPLLEQSTGLFGLSARALGLPIGSGMIESGNRHVLQARLKQAGTAWLPDHADQIAHLRVLRVNQQLELPHRRLARSR